MDTSSTPRPHNKCKLYKEIKFCEFYLDKCGTKALPRGSKRNQDLNLDNLIRLACTLLIPLMGYVWKHTKGCFKSRLKYV